MNIPPGAASPAIYDLLLDTGVRNFYLRVHVFVQPGRHMAWEKRAARHGAIPATERLDSGFIVISEKHQGMYQ